MEKYIPYEKLSKKEKRRLDSRRRTTWGPVSPVTRKPESSKAYNRNKARNWRRDSQFRDFCLLFPLKRDIISLSIPEGGIPMKLLIALLGAVFLLTGCGGAKAPAYRQISPAEAAALMESETDFIILDVRTQAEYDQGHIPGAICIPNETIGGEEIPALPDKSQLILVYCRSGNRSRQAAQKLADSGYTGIVEFGGILSWTGETVAS